MRRYFAVLLVLTLVLMMAGCQKTPAPVGQTENSPKEETMPTFEIISQEKAYEMMQDPNVLVLDVREQSEFDALHIPGAVLLPVGDIDEETARAVIPEKDTTVLVYCRSGNRSKVASSALVQLGYTAVYEFGGSGTWPYETVSENAE